MNLRDFHIGLEFFAGGGAGVVPIPAPGPSWQSVPLIGWTGRTALKYESKSSGIRKLMVDVGRI